MRRNLLLSMLSVIIPASMTALGQTSRFTGQITDKQNAVVQGAEVEAVNKATLGTTTAKTNAEGSYTIPFLPAGNYQIEVRATGFSPSVSGVIPLARDKHLSTTCSSRWASRRPMSM